MADEKTALPGSSYDKVVSIINAYNQFPAEVPPGEVATLIGVDATEVSRNNGFLVSVGILEGGRRKQLSGTGRELSRALEHDIEEEISRLWRDLVMKNDFLEKLLSAIRIRRGMDMSTLQSHIAYSAGQPRTAKIMTGTGAVVEILRVAKLVDEKDGKIVTTGTSGTSSTEADTSPAVTSHTVERTEVPRPSMSPGPRQSVAPLGGISIQIQIQCTPGDLDELPSKISALLDAISPPSGTESSV